MHRAYDPQAGAFRVPVVPLAIGGGLLLVAGLVLVLILASRPGTGQDLPDTAASPARQEVEPRRPVPRPGAVAGAPITLDPRALNLASVRKEDLPLRGRAAVGTGRVVRQEGQSVYVQIIDGVYTSVVRCDLSRGPHDVVFPEQKVVVRGTYFGRTDWHSEGIHILTDCTISPR